MDAVFNYTIISAYREGLIKEKWGPFSVSMDKKLVLGRQKLYPAPASRA
jgi:hypothetical protein